MDVQVRYALADAVVYGHKGAVGGQAFLHRAGKEPDIGEERSDQHSEGLVPALGASSSRPGKSGRRSREARNTPSST
ncbi:hypothetical protein [Desulfofundulus sp.]|uniref:hypothetical protein n=1 Tax=Desulfofundulus sp. TaxID=2282750 RepID=UPI003C763341